MNKSQKKEKQKGESAFDRMIRLSRNRKQAFERLLKVLEDPEHIPSAKHQSPEESKTKNISK